MEPIPLLALRRAIQRTAAAAEALAAQAPAEDAALLRQAAGQLSCVLDAVDLADTDKTAPQP